MEMHWSSPLDVYRKLFPLPETCFPLASVRRFPSLSAKRWNRKDLSHFSFAWFVVLLMGKYGTGYVPSSVSPSHPEMILFLLQSRELGNRLFLFLIICLSPSEREICKTTGPTAQLTED